MLLPAGLMTEHQATSDALHVLVRIARTSAWANIEEELAEFSLFRCSIMDPLLTATIQLSRRRPPKTAKDRQKPPKTAKDRQKPPETAEDRRKPSKAYG